MASGNTLFSCVPGGMNVWTRTTAEAALRGSRATSGSYPRRVMACPAAADSEIQISGIMPPHYAGGGVTVSIYWAASNATTGDCVWTAAWERHTTDLDVHSLAAARTTTSTTNGTNGVITVTSIAFTNGAQMDSVAAGEGFTLEITRDANAAGDTMANDAHILAVEVRET
jgi:hypothetical protein